VVLPIVSSRSAVADVEQTIQIWKNTKKNEEVKFEIEGERKRKQTETTTRERMKACTRMHRRKRNGSRKAMGKT
jgi:hypothetical protein